MSSSHVSPQVCRPHFHAPLPWLSEPPKTLSSSTSWGSPFACPQEPQDIKLSSQVQGAQSGQHLFSFPPTPPKDSTPDSVQTGPSEYQAAVNAFMHQAQVTSNNSGANGDGTNCGLDVKPCLSGGGSNNGGNGVGGASGGGQSAPKQREGTNNNNNSSSNNNNNGTSLNGGLFDSPQNYGVYEASYGYHQSSSAFQSNSNRPTMSPHTKPQRTKARTSAGKIWTRCGDFILYFKCDFFFSLIYF
jgi:GATA-binding protein 2